MSEKALFKSPEQAIKYAYRIESRSIVKVISYFSGLCGSTLKQKRSDGPWDDHAQASMILSLMDRTISGDELIAIRARYTIPSTGTLEYRKATDCVLLTEHILALRSMPIYFVLDTVRGWAGYRRTKADRYWSEELKISDRVIRGWRGGRADRGWKGIIRILDEFEAGAISAMHGPMESAGLI